MTRASDAEREEVVARLRAAAGEGRLTVEELAERIGAAYGATTRGELEPLTADLPASSATPVTVAAGTGAEPRSGGSSLVLGILGGGDRKGRWRVARRLTVVNVLGGADLDLREATLEAPEVEITVWSLLGGSDITVPEGVHVAFEDFALLGGNDLKISADPAPPGAPVIRIRAYSVLGGTDVRTGGRARRRHGLPGPPPAPPLP